ncbi:hypothetical protein JCM6882_008641 [Rhodosporidiobolus microsporus]
MSWYSGTTNTGAWGGQGDDESIRSSWITWCSLVIVAVVVLALLVSRFFYIRRYYSPTFRSYFVPPKGIHIKWLGISIVGPPPRAPREPPPSYYQTTGQRRRRRHRQTVGETLGAGGTRLGQRDEDDMWEGDEVDMAERGVAGPGAMSRGGEMLPQYYVDLGLPQYQTGDGTAAEEAERIRAIAAAGQDAEALPSAAEYEAASRAARNAAAAADGAGAEGGDGANDGTTPTYPPVAHLAPSSAPPASSSSSTTTTSRPSAVRSTTARSANFLASLPFLNRAPSPTPPPASAPAGVAGAAAPRASTSQETFDDARTLDDRASDETAAIGRHRRPGGGVHRSSSSASGSSGGTKLGSSDEDDSEEGGARRKKDVDAGALTASSSKVRLDGAEKAEEEKVEQAEVTKEEQGGDEQHGERR